MMIYGKSVRQHFAYYWIWLTTGYQPISFFVNLGELMMIFIMWLRTIYGISLPWWQASIIGIAGLSVCIIGGYFWLRWQIQKEITTILNDNNREVTLLYTRMAIMIEDNKEMKAMLKSLTNREK